MNSYQFDSLKFATEGLTGYGSTVIMDNANLPSFMKPINQITNAQLFAGGSSKVAEAFNVDGVLYKRFFISNFLNTIVNGRAYSWPGVDPRASINFDESVKACNAKGTGFHLMSIPERAVINHLIYKSGFVPRGNTQYGKITPIHTKPAKQPQQKATVPAAQEQPEQRPDQARRHGSTTEHARESRTGLEIAGSGVLVCVLRTAKFRSSPATLPRNRYHTPTRPHSGRLSSRTDHLLNLEQPEL